LVYATLKSMPLARIRCSTISLTSRKYLDAHHRPAPSASRHAIGAPLRLPRSLAARTALAGPSGLA
jgi:hypothetical protein